MHRQPAAAPPDREWAERIRGLYDARYLAYDGLREAGTEKELHATVTLRNEGWRPWFSVLEEGPDFVSYHWLDRQGRRCITMVCGRCCPEL